MPPRAQRGGEAGLMLINEYLTLKFNFHLLVSETRLCQRCRRCLGFFPKVNSSSNLEKKKVRNIEFKRQTRCLQHMLHVGSTAPGEYWAGAYAAEEELSGQV